MHQHQQDQSNSLLTSGREAIRLAEGMHTIAYAIVFGARIIAHAMLSK